MRHSVSAFSVILLCLGGPAQAAEAAGGEPQATALNIQPTAPEVNFADLEGGQHRLSDFRGRIVLLEFWAPWCAPCREGFPFLDRLQAAHAEGFSVIAVTMEENTRSIEDFVRSHPSGFLVGRDPGGESGDAFGVDVMPTSILIDAGGRIAARYGGGTPEVHASITRDVERLLNGAAPSGGAGATVARKSKQGVIRPWQRGYLADPIMSLDGDVISRSIAEEIHASKEAAAGSGGVAGGGCGCN